MKRIYLFYFLLPLCTLYPQEGDYFPLALGNTWTYLFYENTYENITILKDSVDNRGTRYFSTHSTPPTVYKWDYTVSPAKDSIYWMDDILIYIANCDSGDTWFSRWETDSLGVRQPTERAVVTNTGYALLFNNIYRAKEISYYFIYDGDTVFTGQNWINSDIYAENIGLVNSGIEYYGYSYQRLTGCVLNGDSLGYIYTGVGITELVPLGEPELFQNYPNPFNPSTRISYSIPEYSHVSLIVYDMLGREVSRLVDDFQAAGAHQVTFNAEAISTGIYFYRLNIGNNSITKKMFFIK